MKIYNFETQTIQSVENSEAHQLEQGGKGKIVDLGDLDVIEQQIEKAVDKYRAKYTEITTSDNPVYKVEGAVDYYTAELKAGLDAEVTELQTKYEGLVNGMKQAAKEDLANQSEFISDKARQEASDIINETVLAIKYGDPIGAINTLIENANYYGDTRKLSLLNELSRLAEATNGHPRQKEIDRKIKSLYHKLNEVKEGRMLPIKIAEALSPRGDDAYRRLTMTHVTFKDSRNNMHNPGKQ